jgi:hypothetical protein
VAPIVQVNNCPSNETTEATKPDSNNVHTDANNQIDDGPASPTELSNHCSLKETFVAAAKDRKNEYSNETNCTSNEKSGSALTKNKNDNYNGIDRIEDGTVTPNQGSKVGKMEMPTMTEK